MTDLVLITGGAGFIGYHTTLQLVEKGYRVRILDNLNPQIHAAKTPSHLALSEVETIIGDVRDYATVLRALDQVRYVFHMAAETGVGQSMYEMEKHVSVNVQGTATLWQAISDSKDRVQRVILTSSRAVYGEGAYECESCGSVNPTGRDKKQLEQGDWEMRCPLCGSIATDSPTSEDCLLAPISVYGLTKKHQEELCTLMSSTLGINTIILRYFNVFGPHQTPSNPYTGIVSLFCSRLLHGEPVDLYENGLPIRDFIHVHDVVRANLAAMESETNETTMIVNIGTGSRITLYQLANEINMLTGSEGELRRTGLHRVGDIFSCYADTSKAGKVLGFRADVALDQGLVSLIDWIRDANVGVSSTDPIMELEARGLLIDSGSFAS